jgi:serine protease AprX
VGGTSMASPIVAGIAADLLQAHPKWTPDQVKRALVTRTRPTPGGAGEVAADLALNAHPSRTPISAGIPPSTWLDPTTGTIDYARASWSRASWSTAAGDLAADWSRASWRCADCGGGGTIDPTRASWRQATWSTFFGDAPGASGTTSSTR